ncbi:MAG TPA: alpha/beta hydrolase [Gemmatimonadaceae bacterium]|nr:alpha/beta hydrolase [Gemmatimonadaceae bacterium]
MSDSMAGQARRDDPHGGQPVRTAGTPLARARAAMVMVHGRGATAESILELAPFLATEGVAFLAPQAGGGQWYPYGFMAPIERNEPGVSSGMRAIARVLDDVQAAGIPPERTLLLGFSQGACLATEFAARHARRYGGVACLSGGLIGPDGTPVFLGCSDVDAHIPEPRVRESAEVLRRMGGEVTMRIYPGMAHTINDDEIDEVRRMVEAALDAGPGRARTAADA